MDYFDKIKELEIKNFDTAHTEHRYLVSYKENHFEVNKTLLDLIIILQSSKSINGACEKYSLKQGRTYSVKDMSSLLDNKLSIFFSGSNNIRNKTFIYKHQIINAIRVNQIASILKNLYGKYLYIFIFLANSILLVHFLFNYFDLISFSLNNLDTYTFLFVIISLFLSTFFHELGHASACKFYDVKPGGIGLGVYINMVVFYADVSNIWQLSRKERIVVNLGGIYFQSLLLIPCYFLFFYTQDYLLGYLILCTNLNFLFVLNPFFKFDGYWIMSDVLGVPNLRQRSMELVRYMFTCLQKNKSTKKPQLLCITSTAKCISLVYTAFSFLFMIFFFGYFIPRFVYQYIIEIPNTYNLLEMNISNGIIPFDFIFYILPKTILVVFIGIYMLKSAMKLGKIVYVNINYMKERKKVKI